MLWGKTFKQSIGAKVDMKRHSIKRTINIATTLILELITLSSVWARKSPCSQRWRIRYTLQRWRWPNLFPTNRCQSGPLIRSKSQYFSNHRPNDENQSGETIRILIYEYAGQIFCEMLGQACYKEFFEKDMNGYQEVYPIMRSTLT